MVLKHKESRRQDDAKARALDEVSQEPTSRLNAEIPLSLHNAVKIQAVNEGRTLAGIVAQALNEYLSKVSNESLKL